MLALSRKENEVIRIADVIDITILQIKGNSVRIGIEAPKDVSICRKEIWYPNWSRVKPTKHDAAS